MGRWLYEISVKIEAFSHIFALLCGFARNVISFDRLLPCPWLRNVYRLNQ